MSKELHQTAPRLVGRWLPDELIPPHLRELVVLLRRDYPNGFIGSDEREDDDWPDDDCDDD